MTITAGDVITKARQYLADDGQGTPAVSTADMFAPLNRGQLALIQRRPDLMVSSTGVSETYTAATVVGDVLIWPDDFLEALANYLAFDILSDDSKTLANRAEAQYRLGEFEREIS